MSYYTYIALIAESSVIIVLKRVIEMKNARCATTWGLEEFKYAVFVGFHNSLTGICLKSFSK